MEGLVVSASMYSRSTLLAFATARMAAVRGLAWRGDKSASRILRDRKVEQEIKKQLVIAYRVGEELAERHLVPVERLRWKGIKSV